RRQRAVPPVPRPRGHRVLAASRRDGGGQAAPARLGPPRHRRRRVGGAAAHAGASAPAGAEAADPAAPRAAAQGPPAALSDHRRGAQRRALTSLLRALTVRTSGQPSWSRSTTAIALGPQPVATESS